VVCEIVNFVVVDSCTDIIIVIIIGFSVYLHNSPGDMADNVWLTTTRMCVSAATADVFSDHCF